MWNKVYLNNPVIRNGVIYSWNNHLGSSELVKKKTFKRCKELICFSHVTIYLIRVVTEFVVTNKRAINIIQRKLLGYQAH